MEYTHTQDAKQDRTQHQQHALHTINTHIDELKAQGVLSLGGNFLFIIICLSTGHKIVDSYEDVGAETIFCLLGLCFMSLSVFNSHSLSFSYSRYSKP